MKRADVLVEIGCEELPARLQERQVRLLADGLGARLEQAGLIDGSAAIETFSGPRRLAVRIGAVAAGQEDRRIERKGPADKVAFDDDGRPTRAAEGFARSVGRSVDELEWLETDEGRWLMARIDEPGRSLDELLPGMLASVVADMAGARSMRWADRDDRFLRPVRWLVALHGKRVVPLALFGLESGRATQGHRVHAPGPHDITRPDKYETVLERARVIAEPAARRERIVAQAGRLADDANLELIADPALADEVAALTEWPVAVLGSFDPAFLEVPDEALIASMEHHQKCFALRAGNGALAPKFVAVANIESRDPAAMTAGFERVIRPRLADARFFLDQDRKTPLADRRERLDQVLFQEKLGSIGDKVRRLERLAVALAERLDADPDTAARAAALCKCDLVTEMVGEFPELQGIMGSHYARADGEDEAVATAIASHYRPQQARDALPGDGPGQALALADRLDTLVGAFAAGQKPRGSKDPFALRRAALGVVRLVEATGLPARIDELIALAGDTLADTITVDDDVRREVAQFIFERLRSHAADQGLATNTVHAVAAGRPGTVADFMARARAVQAFADDPVMASLIAANKRAGNLLSQAGKDDFGEVDDKLLQENEEKRLFDEVVGAEGDVQARVAAADYPAALDRLARLGEPLDRFFDRVMVMTDDAALSANRLALLARLRRLFVDVADVARLGR